MMAQSPEYPDLRWVQPKAWSSGRPYGPPLWVVVHTTQGSEGVKSAEDGAAYDTRRTDGTSTHYFHDQDTTIQCVRTSDRANGAKGTGNHYGIHHELCGKAEQNSAQWQDAASAGTIRNAAKQAARDCKKWGIPVRKLSVAQVRGHEKGLCEHHDISLAFGQSDHTDPGRSFPWPQFLDMVKAELAEPARASRKVEYMELTVKVPILQEGDRDDDREGYNLIDRIQKIVGADDDGIWGPATTAKIAAWCDVPTASARKLTEDIYRKVFGASR
jgi:hypothetical protein